MGWRGGTRACKRGANDRLAQFTPVQETNRALPPANQPNQNENQKPSGEAALEPEQVAKIAAEAAVAAEAAALEAAIAAAAPGGR